jgi:hypothetical protein
MQHWIVTLVIVLDATKIDLEENALVLIVRTRVNLLTQFSNTSVKSITTKI